MPGTHSPTVPNSQNEKEQILAFSYGFLTHAAGDIWSHTLVNEFAEGPFPAIGHVLTDAEAASNAIRHVLVENYISDATPGFDGNPNRTTLPDGDVSDDATPAIEFAAPNRFIYETFIAGDNGRPVQTRGVLLDFFFDLREKLQTEIGHATPQILELSNAVLDSASDCLSGNFDAASCATNLGEIFLASTRDDLLQSLKIAYLTDWMNNIDEGLENWSEMSLAITNGLFNPQARRDLQNIEGAKVSSDEHSTLRIQAEDGVGLVDTVLHQIGVGTDDNNSYFNKHLLPMLGVPEFVVKIKNVLGDLVDDFDNLINALGRQLNPIREPIATLNQKVHEIVSDLVKDAVKEWIGFDVQVLENLLNSPSAHMDLTQINLGGALGNVSLFQSGDHAKLDAYLGITGNHHDTNHGGLTDQTTFHADNFAAYENAVTMAKLLMLDGTELDQVLTDLSGSSYSLYGPANGNVMTTPLPGVTIPDLSTLSSNTASVAEHQASRDSANKQWLNSIDASWAWQEPVYTVANDGTLDTHHGGLGNFPLYRDSQLRTSVFQKLFDDWGANGNLFQANDLAISTPDDPLDDNNVASTIKNGLTQLVAWLNQIDNSNTFTQTMPLVSKSVSNILDLSTVFDQHIASPISNMLTNDPTPTSAELVNLLKGLGTQLGNLTIEIDKVLVSGGRYSKKIGATTRDEARYDLRMRAIRESNLEASLGEDAANEFGLRDLDANVPVRTTFEFDLSFGYDLSQQPANAFFAEVNDLSVTTSIHERNLSGPLRVGFLGLEVDRGAVTMDGRIDVSPDFNLAHGRYSAADLSLPIANTVSITTLQDTLDLEFPVTANLGSFDGFLVASGIMTVSGDSETIFQSDELNVEVAFFDELLNFNDIDSISWGGLWEQLGVWFDSLTVSSFFSDDSPNTETSTGNIFQMGTAFVKELVSPLFNQNEQPNFSTAQGLIDLLANKLSDTPSANYDPVSKELTFDLSFETSIDPLQDEPLNFSATAFDSLVELSTSSTVDFTASLDFDMTLGVVLNLSTTELIATSDGPADGKLTAPASFRLTIVGGDRPNENSPISVTETITINVDNSNQSLDDLIADINSAVPTSFKTRVRAERRQNRIALVGINDDESSLFILRSGDSTDPGTTDAHDPTVTQLGFDEIQSAQDSLGRRFFVEDVQLNGTAMLDADDIDATAKLGLVSVEIVDGTASGDLTMGLKVMDPLTQTVGGRVFLEDLFGALVQDPLSLIVGPNFGASLDLELPLEATILGSQVSGNPKAIVTWNDVFNGDPVVELQNADELINFQNIGFGNIVDALREIGDLIADMQGTDVFAVEIPGLGISLGELFDYADEFLELVDLLEENPSEFVETLETTIENVFSINDDALDISLIENGDVLRFDLTLDKSIGVQVPLNLDTEFGDIVDINSSGLLDATANVALDLDFGLDLSDPEDVKPFLYETTSLGINAKVEGDDIDFSTVLGPAGLFIRNGEFIVDRDGNASTTNDTAFIGLVLDDLNGQTTDGRILLNEFDTDNIGFSLQGKVKAKLPVYFPVETQFLGNIELTIGDLNDIEKHYNSCASPISRTPLISTSSTTCWA